MRKNVLFALIVSAVLFGVTSCVDDDVQYYDKEWADFNTSLFYGAEAKGHHEVNSLTNNGFVFVKRYTAENSPFSQVVPIDDSSEKLKPVFGDSVVVRYMGWIYTLDNEVSVFDGTELKHTIDGKEYNWGRNNTQGIGLRIGIGLIDGWIATLYQMEEGDAVNIAVPFSLGYGSSGSGNIPGYTTLWFDIKLLKVIKQ